MKHRIAVTLLAFALAGCATTDAGHNNGGNYAGVYDGGYYVAAQDGYGDYYYDRPQVVYTYGSWYSSDPFAFYGFGFSPWGFGYGPWWGGRPWGWRHEPGWHHGWAPPHAVRNVAQPDPGPRAHENRAPRHDSQHSRP